MINEPCPKCSRGWLGLVHDPDEGWAQRCDTCRAIITADDYDLSEPAGPDVAELPDEAWIEA